MLDPRLNHVVAVSRTGSFTAAAEMVGVTQSAITKSVADLERQVGYTIFHRTSRGAMLTEEGREFVERTSRLLEDAKELFHPLGKQSDPFAGVLRVGVCPASLEWWLVEPVSNLLSRHPSILLDVSGSSFERMIQRVRSGDVDVALGFDAAFREWPDIRRAPLASNEIVLFVRKNHPLLEKDVVTQDDLSEFDFVSPSDSQPYGGVIRGFYENQNIEWERRLHIVDFFPIVRSIVETTDAIGVVSNFYALSSTFGEKFKTIDQLEPFTNSPLCCASRARWEPKPAVKAFISAVRSHIPPIPSNSP